MASEPASTPLLTLKNVFRLLAPALVFLIVLIGYIASLWAVFLSNNTVNNEDSWKNH